MDRKDIPLGVGIYPIPEAARLTRIHPVRIRRWLRGYRYPTKSGVRYSRPVWTGQLNPIDSTVALGFSDLVELMIVDRFIKAGVTWKEMRRAHEEASKLVGSAHPFCTGKFRTNGSKVFKYLSGKGRKTQVLDVVSRQPHFRQIVEPFFQRFDFHQGEAAMWWPLGRRHNVVIDPARSFGSPIVAEAGTPTRVLFAARKAGDNIKTIASWYGISQASVHDAIKFERSFAA